MRCNAELDRQDETEKPNMPKTKMNKRNDPRLGGLRILFKEVLEQIPPEKADDLRKGYLAGRKIVFILNQSSHGEGCKTAFSFCLADSVEQIQQIPSDTKCEVN